MPQHPTPAAPSSPRYRIIFDPPLPFSDGILREHDAAEQRRLKCGAGHGILLRLCAEILVAVIGLLIIIFPTLSAAIALDHTGKSGFAALTGWDIRPPFWVALVLAFAWSVLDGIYIMEAFDMVLSGLVGIVMLIPILPVYMVVIGIGPLWWVLSVSIPIILNLVGAAQGYGTVIATVLWAVLMVAPIPLSLLFDSSHFG